MIRTTRVMNLNCKLVLTVLNHEWLFIHVVVLLVCFSFCIKKRTDKVHSYFFSSASLNRAIAS